MPSSRRHFTLMIPVFAAALALLVPAARADEPIVIGFVTHAQGDPFVQQIIDGAEAAAHDLGVTLKVAQHRRRAGGPAEAGAESGQCRCRRCRHSVPGDSMARG